jgi:hypothetical protein
VYVWAERLGSRGAGLAGLRAGALTGLIVLWVNPARTEQVRGGSPTVLLDASLSMQSHGGRWAEAVDTALALAGGPGGVLRFGWDVAPFDTTAPAAGATRLDAALRAAAGRPGPVIVVSDGAIDDAGALPPSLTRGVELVLLPRDTIPDAALVDVELEARAQRGDSIAGTYMVATDGPLAARTGRLEVLAGNRRLLGTDVALPPPPGVARRRFTLPGTSLAAGTHVLTFRLTVPGDSEPGDDTRLRVVTLSDQPDVVALINPPDWEGRFLVSTVSSVANTTVRGFARVRPDRWVDMRTMEPVAPADIRGAVRSAALVLARGDVEPEIRGWAGPLWRWPAGTEAAAQTMPGEWYVSPEVPASPLGGRLAAAEWDSVPPVRDMVPAVVERGDWVALTARLARRGADRPVLLGRDSGGMRTLVTAGDGLWRWSLRGGAAREAYRALVASGVDWLLGADALRRAAPLSSSDVVPRGSPVVFRWTRQPVPDSVSLRVRGEDSTRVVTLHFGANGTAQLLLPPGVYRWDSPDVAGPPGLAAVEPYSDEFRVRQVNFRESGEREAFSVVELRPRDLWWIFALVIVLFLGEWAWRLSRGLP